MCFAVKHLKTACPRVITPVTSVPPCLIFVDGACEDETSVGGVLIDPLGMPEFFGAVVSPATVDTWKSKLGQEQVIGQAELFPLLVSRLIWSERIRGRRVIFLLDNESARIGAIKAYSPVLASLEIITRCIGLDYDLRISPWYARVPTCCNIADGPSRMDPSSVVSLLSAQCAKPVFPAGSIPANILI